jgi:Ca2+-binding RTX toxin-like protein
MKRSTAWGSVLASTVLLITGTFAIPASAAVPRCFGEKATIVGTSGGDILNGTARPDVIVGLAGSDTIRGKGKADLICAGKGNDSVHGGKGIDLTFGGGGNDEIFGDAGAFNQAVPGPGNDQVDGGPGGGDEVIYLDATGPITGDLGTGAVTGFGTDEVSNVEWLIGGPFDDSLTGSEASDVIFGADGNDTIDTLGGDDNPAGGAGDDAIDGGDGFDLLANYFLPVYYGFPPPAGPITIDLPAGTLTGEGADTLVGIEAGEGSTGDDVMIGDEGDNQFTSLNEGSDTVDAGGGDDLVDGGEGADDLDGGAGVDLLGNLDASAGMTIDLSTLTDSQGDTLAGFEDVIGTFFDDAITGNDGPNEVQGADGDDDLFGLGGDDVLIGDFFGFTAGGTDSADGGLGTDQCDAEMEVACEADPPPPTSMASSSGGANGSWAYGLAYGRVARIRF